VTTARNALQEAIKHSGRFKHWTKPAHGLSLSVIQPNDIGSDFRVVLVAVRNTTGESLKLTSDSPDLSVEMLDEQGKPINIRAIQKLQTEVSEPTGVIPAGAKAYYAIVFAAPVLGVHQQMKIVVSQTNAADEPASIMLANASR